MMSIRRMAAWLVAVILFAQCAPALAEGVLTLPRSIKAIEDEAFCGSKAVSSVALPEGIETIGKRAFADSTLTKINLPVSLTYIADDALEGCASVAVDAEEGSYAYEWAAARGFIGEGTPENSLEMTAVNVESSGKIRISWEAVEGAAVYKVMRGDSKNGTFTRLASTASTELTNTSAEVGKEYFYYVVALGEDNAELARSMTVSCVCALPRPALTVSGVDKTGKIRLDWEAVVGASGYEVIRSEDELEDAYYQATAEEHAGLCQGAGPDRRKCAAGKAVLLPREGAAG